MPYCADASGRASAIVRGVLCVWAPRTVWAPPYGRLLAADRSRTAAPTRTGRRACLAVGVLLVVAVLAIGVLDATELLVGTVSLACAVVCASPVLGLLRRLTVLADAELPGTGLADGGLTGSAILLAGPELSGRVVVGRARLPCLPEPVVGRLLAVAVDALTGLLDGGELSRPVLRLLPLLRTGLLLRSPVLTGPVLRATDLVGRSQL